MSAKAKDQGLEIYFHVGLGKTGTTFLQYRAFPFFKGFRYIQRTQYRKAKDIIRREGDQRYFLSFECDQQLEEVARNWAEDYPSTRPIICFRRHDGWIASQYRRFVKNGHVRNFQEMLDLQNDQGRFRQSDLHFRPMISLLEECFEHPPLVFLYEDMKKNPVAFIEGFAAKMGSSVNAQAVDLSSKHSSYSPRQLRFLLRVMKYIPLNKRVVFQNRVIEFVRKTLFEGLRYLFLFLGRFWPDKGEGGLMLESDKEAVCEFYKEDWDAVLDYVEKQANSLSV